MMAAPARLINVVARRFRLLLSLTGILGLVLPGLASCDGGESSDEPNPIIDPCVDEDCSGHGSCLVTSAMAPICLCESGFESQGSDCVPMENACQEITCSDHGSCVSSDAGPACICDGGYHQQGTDCVADPDPCLGVDCDGHGSCVVTAADAVCLCDYGHYAVGLSCVEAPADVLPDYYEPDLSATKIHPNIGIPYLSNILNVIAVDGHDAAALHLLASSLGARLVAYEPSSRWYMLEFPSDVSFQDFTAAKASIEASPLVLSVADEFQDTPALGEVNDPGWGLAEDWDETTPDGSNWYFELIRAISAWELAGTHHAVKLGIIDYGSPDTGDLNIVDAYANANYPFHDHGTKVTGVAGSIANNAVGFTGLLWNAQVYYCQTAGHLYRFVKCMEWMTDRGVKVINYSAGAGYRYSEPPHGPFSPECGPYANKWECDFIAGVAPETNPSTSVELDEASAIWQQRLNNILSDSWLLVQAAGNDALVDASYSALSLRIATDPNANQDLKNRLLVVGAVGFDEQLASYSNRGPLHIVAPGGDGTAAGTNMQMFGGTDWGTSFAAPLVAATAALVWHLNPNLDAEAVRDLILTGSQIWGKTATDGNHVYPLLNVADVIGELNCLPSCVGKTCGEDDGCGAPCSGPEQQSCSGDTLNYCLNGNPGVFDCAASGFVCQDGACELPPQADAPPQGQILSPIEWDTVSTSFTVDVEAIDDVDLETITVIIANVDGEVYSESIDTSGTFVNWSTASIDPTAWDNGTYWIALWLSDGVTAVEADVNGLIVSNCTPDCAGKECGGDGCGGTCGAGCPPMEYCSIVGACEDDMVLVPAGLFPMGSPVGEGDPDENPQHDITLSAYWMDRYEVSAADFVEFLNTIGNPGGSYFLYSTSRTIAFSNPTYLLRTNCQSVPAGLNNESCAQHPASGVRWAGALAYCQWKGKRLPTEAEWERAATGTAHNLFPWGDSAVVTGQVNCGQSLCGDGFDYTSPIGYFGLDVSPEGCADMAGNVREWVWDWYDATYYSSSPASDPQGPSSGTQRVQKGGTYSDSSLASLRVSTRGGWSSVAAQYGFRCAMSSN